MTYGRNDTFIAEDESGNKVKCDILFSFDNLETGKSYIVYTDYSLDDSGQFQVYVSRYSHDSSDGRLLPIETEQEWQPIRTMIENLQKEIDRKTTGNRLLS